MASTRFTFGGQVAWLLYNTVSATGGSTPITLANTATETSAINKSSNSAPAYAATANTGLAYASFLIGQIDKGSFTQYLQQEFGARFRAISPYVQDNWRVTPKLTLDLGLRYDFFPTVTEVHNAGSFFNPNLANPVTGVNGALQFAGNGANTCNCSTPVNNYYKNFGPRIGVAYQVDPKTVIRASYGIMFTHGNAVGGSATSLGTLGFSAAPSFSANGQLLSTLPLTGTNGAIPAYTAATGTASGPHSVPATPTPAAIPAHRPASAMPILISAAALPSTSTGASASSISGPTPLPPPSPTSVRRVTSCRPMAPMLAASGPISSIRNISRSAPTSDLTGTALTSFCAANAGVCPSCTSELQHGPESATSLSKPFPFQAVTDHFGYVANSNYNALQATFNMRASHGLTFMANYTWSRSIDNGGTFRTGYAIPAAFSDNGKA